MRIKLTRQLGHSPRGSLPLAVELDPDAAAGFIHGLIPTMGVAVEQGCGGAGLRGRSGGTGSPGRSGGVGPPGRCG